MSVGICKGSSCPQILLCQGMTVSLSLTYTLLSPSSMHMAHRHVHCYTRANTQHFKVTIQLSSSAMHKRQFTATNAPLINLHAPSLARILLLRSLDKIYQVTKDGVKYLAKTSCSL